MSLHLLTHLLGYARTGSCRFEDRAPITDWLFAKPQEAVWKQWLCKRRPYSQAKRSWMIQTAFRRMCQCFTIHEIDLPQNNLSVPTRRRRASCRGQNSFTNWVSFRAEKLRQMKGWRRADRAPFFSRLEMPAIAISVVSRACKHPPAFLRHADTFVRLGIVMTAVTPALQSRRAARSKQEFLHADAGS